MPNGHDLDPPPLVIDYVQDPVVPDPNAIRILSLQLNCRQAAGSSGWQDPTIRKIFARPLRVAHALTDLPQIDGAFAAGRVSYSKVRALTRVATPANDTALLEMALSSTASQLERICRGYRQVLIGQGGRPEDEAAHCWLRERDTADGFVRFEVQLRVEEAAVLRQAIETARQRAWSAADVSAGTPLRDLTRVDALVAVAEDYLQGIAHAGESGPPVELVVHVEPDARGRSLMALRWRPPRSNACNVMRRSSR